MQHNTTSRSNVKLDQKLHEKNWSKNTAHLLRKDGYKYQWIAEVCQEPTLFIWWLYILFIFALDI